MSDSLGLVDVPVRLANFFNHLPDGQVAYWITVNSLLTDMHTSIRRTPCVGLCHFSVISLKLNSL